MTILNIQIFKKKYLLLFYVFKVKIQFNCDILYFIQSFYDESTLLSTEDCKLKF